MLAAKPTTGVGRSTRIAVLKGVVRHSIPVLAEGFEVEQRERSKAGIVERLSARRPGLDRGYAG